MKCASTGLWVISALGLGLVAVPVAAGGRAEQGFYVGGGFGQSVFQTESVSDLESDLAGAGITGSIDVDDTDTAWKLFGGYQFFKHLAVEGAYVDLGELKADINVTAPLPVTGSAKFEATGFQVAAVGTYPFANGFGIFGKLGLMYWDVETEVTATSGVASASASASETGLDPIAGVGARYQFQNNVGIRVEWERYFSVGDEEETDEGDIDFFSAGVYYLFE